MIAPQITVRWEGFQKDRKRVKDLKLWSPSALKKMDKLLTIATTVTMMVKERVMVRGTDSKGSRYKPYGKKDNLWIPPWYPQPGAPGSYRIKGPLSRYLVYPNREVYQQARQLPPFRNFFMSGGMWKSLQAKAVGPGYVRVMFAGSSPRYYPTAKKRRQWARGPQETHKMPKRQTMQNRKKASGAARNSGRDLLAFNRAEATEHLKLMTAYCNAYVFHPEWQEDRRGFKIKTLEAKIQRTRNGTRKKINKVMKKAGSNTRFAPSQKGSNENVK